MKICFLYLLSHHLVRKVKGKITVFLIYIKSVLNVTHKNPHLKLETKCSTIILFLVSTCAFMRQIDGILKARKMHIYLFRIDFLLFSTIVVVTKIKMHININCFLQMVCVAKGKSLRLNIKFAHYLQMVTLCVTTKWND